MAKRITRDALMIALSLIIFIIESRIPSIIPVPGIKLGLANIVSLYVMFAVGPADCLFVLICRIILGSVFSGSVTAFVFSVTGGIFCYLIMLLLRKILNDKQIFICGVFSAVFHNIGQIAAASVIMKSFSVFTYLPILIISGIITGLLTGFSAQFIYQRLKITDKS